MEGHHAGADKLHLAGCRKALITERRDKLCKECRNKEASIQHIICGCRMTSCSTSRCTRCFQSASIAEKHKLWDETWCESCLEGCNKRKHNNMMERRVQEGELAESVEMHGIFLDSGKNMAQSLIGDLTRR